MVFLAVKEVSLIVKLNEPFIVVVAYLAAGNIALGNGFTLADGINYVLFNIQPYKGADCLPSRFL